MTNLFTDSIFRLSYSLIILFCLRRLSGEEQWDYGQCRSGKKQSPIDLAKDASIIGRYQPLDFKNYDTLLQNAKIRNTGHSRKYNY